MDSCLHRFFSPDEVNRLERGLPRLAEWSPQMLVPFQARKLRRAKILWINRRWFLERQIDVARDEIRNRVKNWLLDEFAYALPSEHDASDAFTTSQKTLHADRYGISTGRTIHGGSGRVATIGCFQAKGIGVTPLAGTGANWVHSNGCSSIEEAIREVIYSEIAAAEFPHGAVPAVAILDTGLHFSAPAEAKAPASAHQSMRRAIIIRPAVLRVAHTERAPLFTKSLTGYLNSQPEDAQRTRDVVTNWSMRASAKQSIDIEVCDLAELTRRIAEQVAFGQAHRLFSGGYFSSNLSADGALLDYGGMRALPNWVNARTLDGVVGFGEEMKIVDKLIESLAFYFNKYRPDRLPAPPPADLLRTLARTAHAHALNRECLRMWGAELEDSETLTAGIMAALRRYFSWQQIFQVNYKHGGVPERQWLYDAVTANPSGAPLEPSMEMQTVEAIDATLRQHFAGRLDCEDRLLHAWSCASRYLMPRETIDRESLQRSIERRIAADPQSHSFGNWVEDFVRTAVSQGRRHWPRLPSDLMVLAHAAYDGSSALLCLEWPTRRQVYWFEGIRVNNMLRLFDSSLTVDQASQFKTLSSGDYWATRVAIQDIGDLPSLQVPSMQVKYRQPSSRLTSARELVA